ncbi:MAG: alkaline phosphatase D family protein [Nannocystaceae bacterium]|nr:alkaline phosphatase family protein [bacterium]
MNAWMSSSLGDALAAGVPEHGAVRVWAHAARPGSARVRALADGKTIAEAPLEFAAESGCTAAVTLPCRGDTGGSIALQLIRDGEICATARARVCPAPGTWANQRLSFAVTSCHQPFTDEGALHPASMSMLDAACTQVETDEVPFILLMGDQLYTDAPASRSLFDARYAKTLGVDDILECSAARVREILHRRYARFAGAPGFARLLGSTATLPMPDDHEFIDNFGTHPDHATPRWRAFREGALAAYRDWQGARATLSELPGASLDYSFTWGPVAVYGLDVRSNRVTADGRTRPYTDEQLSNLRRFLEEHRRWPVLALMVSIPLVHASSAWTDAATSMLPKGSDVHERWSHESCVEARDRLLAAIVEHSAANAHQRVVLLGGDVHAGAAYEVDFAEDGVQLLQLTSSPLTNEEGWINAKAGELAARAVSTLDLADGRHAAVTRMRGLEPGVDHNPFGGLNMGLVDIETDARGVPTVGFRLVSHDGEGQPKTVFATGPLGRRPDPDRRILGLPPSKR